MLILLDGWWRTIFFKFAEHFAFYTRSSIDRPLLLILDNHDSHLSVKTLDFFKEKGITVLSFPPHTSHKLQPLDRSVFGPLKTYIHTQCDAWITGHPGQTLTIYDIPEIVAHALPLALTPSNITAGFKVSGIWPFNPDIFLPNEFLPGFSTDRPDPSEIEIATVELPGEHTHDMDAPGPSFIEEEASSSINNQPGPSTSSSVMSPEEIRPLPKAQPRKVSNRGRKRRYCEILTDTPVKNELSDSKKKAKKMIEKKCKKKECCKSQQQGKRKQKVKRPLVLSSSEEDESNISYAESDDSLGLDGIFGNNEEDDDIEDHLQPQSKLIDEPAIPGYHENETSAPQTLSHDTIEGPGKGEENSSGAGLKSYSTGEYVAVNYGGKTYPGIVTAVDDTDVLASTMEKKHEFWSWPKKKDEIWYRLADVVKRIPPPKLICDAKKTYFIDF